MYGNPMQSMNPMAAQGPQMGMQAPQALPQIMQNYGMPQGPLGPQYANGRWEAPLRQPQANITAPPVGQAGQPVVQGQPVPWQGGFNPFGGFMRHWGGAGRYGPRFDDLAHRTHDAVSGAMGLAGRMQAPPPPPQRGPTLPQPPQFTPPQTTGPTPASPLGASPTQPMQPAAPQGPQFAPPPQMPQQYAGQQLQFAPPPQMPMAGARPFAQGGRVSSLACKCGGGV